MIRTNEGQDPRILEDMFYAKQFAFSYSSLNKLLHSPGLFYRQYVLGDREELTEASVIEGRVIHALLLDQESFTDEFVIAQSKLPSDNVRDVIGRIYEIHKSEDEKRMQLSDFKDEILEILKEKNFYQSIKKDEDRLAKIITEDSQEYFTFLRMSSKKTPISTDTYSRCVEVVDSMKNHPCMKIMGMDDNSDLNLVYNELMVEIDSEYAGFPFGLKGTIDNMFIDNDNKTIRINDVKTTSKTIAEFPETVKYYNYWMQAAIYMRLGRSLAQNLKDDYKDYAIVFSFVVIDRYNQVYVFEVSEETMTNWEIDLQEKLHEAKHHYESRDYSLPYKFLKSKVML
jgi:hypothetical protein